MEHRHLDPMLDLTAQRETGFLASKVDHHETSQISSVEVHLCRTRGPVYRSAPVVQYI